MCVQTKGDVHTINMAKREKIYKQGKLELKKKQKSFIARWVVMTAGIMVYSLFPLVGSSENQKVFFF
jgi:hypothetical protein